jgi:hypothetical protein
MKAPAYMERCQRLVPYTDTKLVQNVYETDHMENTMLLGLSLKIRVAQWSFRLMRYELLSAPHGDMPRTRELGVLVFPL